ncbi:glycosyltransferase family 2 protein [Nitrospina watsonii]|uniref:Two-domain glycosyltransferase n=1 Tax=Nitrospina watsonii TaxID=1323948 RepID=A0ABN8W6G2_9BACT|nr:glycosyltransferase family 2 protein [Nitrospina watsonii]CAI2719216.1 Putative two-domain glycosyltransferase [Nitrospina watsonii]
MTAISIILSTYNRPDALERVLSSLEGQRCRDFEVVVADDGSTEATRALVETFQQRNTLVLKHAWHEDKGFRAAAIRNKAVVASSGEYLVFLDGDCMAFPDFVERSLQLREAGYFVAGNRVLLDESITQQTLNHKLPLHRWGFMKWLAARLRGQVNRLLPFVRLPLGFLRKWTPRKWQGVKTCNLGVWKRDFVEVNGFDETYQGWGYEDSDLVIRLLNLGVVRKEGRFAVPVLHLWHPLNESAETTENWKRLEKVLRSSTTRAEHGLNNHL